MGKFYYAIPTILLVLCLTIVCSLWAWALVVAYYGQ